MNCSLTNILSSVGRHLIIIELKVRQDHLETSVCLTTVVETVLVVPAGEPGLGDVLLAVVRPLVPAPRPTA